jgi:lactoylglutathione lyase
MDFMKPRIDVGLSTNNIEPMLRFWQGEAGVPLDHAQAIRDGHTQHRHDALGSWVKINHFTAPISDKPPSGYLELLIARDGPVRRLTDPDGNRVSLVPPGTHGVEQVALRIGVRDLERHARFYREGFELEDVPYANGSAFRAGESLLLLEERPDAPADATFEGKGWRLLTFQVTSVDQEYDRAMKAGAREILAPATRGPIRIALLRDPDGNTIELMRRE